MMIDYLFVYKKKLISIHSVLNKITGLLLFFLPLSLTFVKTTYSVATVCVFATGAVIQEVYFTIAGEYSGIRYGIRYIKRGELII